MRLPVADDASVRRYLASLGADHKGELARVVLVQLLATGVVAAMPLIVGRASTPSPPGATSSPTRSGSSSSRARSSSRSSRRGARSTEASSSARRSSRPSATM